MNGLISELVGYGIEKGLIEEADKIYVINRGISPLIHYKKRVVNKEGIIKLICIGTIKKQKNSSLK